MLLLTGLFLIILLPWPPRYKFDLKVIKSFYGLYVLVFVPIIAVFFIDLGNFKFSGKRISYEIYNIENDKVTMLKWAGLEFFGITALGILAILIFLFFTYKKMIRFRYFSQTHFFWEKELIILPLFLAFAVFSIRGGWQYKPLQTSDAFLNDRLILGQLTLNPIFTISRTIYKGNRQIYHFLPDSEAVSRFHNRLASPQENWVDPDFPLLKKPANPPRSTPLPNVVIFVMESWSADYMGYSGIPFDLTPCFDSLSRNGVLFTNFFANGQRSVHGIATLLTGMPYIPNASIIFSPLEQNLYKGMGTVFKEQGYQTYFIHGGKYGTMGFASFTKLMGFDHYISMNDFAVNKRTYDGTWGIFDDIVFKHSHEIFKNLPQPFFSVIFSLTSHGPYVLPNSSFADYPDSIPDYDFYNMLKYSDWSLGQFFSLAKNDPYFSNTLFVVLADHARGKDRESMVDLFRIPCLFYKPGTLIPEKNARVGSQVDLLPTFHDLLNFPSLYAGSGISLFQPSPGLALCALANTFGLFTQQYLLISTFDKILGLYDYQLDPRHRNNLLDKNVSLASDLQKDFLAYTQVCNNALILNKVFRELPKTDQNNKKE